MGGRLGVYHIVVNLIEFPNFSNVQVVENMLFTDFNLASVDSKRVSF